MFASFYILESYSLFLPNQKKCNIFPQFQLKRLSDNLYLFCAGMKLYFYLDFVVCNI